MWSQYQTASGGFRDVKDQIRGIISAHKQGTGPGDLALVFKFIKTLDSGIVTEDDVQGVRNSVSIPERFKQYFYQAQDGSSLGGKARDDILNTAVGQYQAVAQGQLELEEEYTERALANGLDVGKSVPDLFKEMRTYFQPKAKGTGLPEGYPQEAGEFTDEEIQMLGKMRGLL